MANKVTDFRSAVELLETIPGQLVTTDVEVEPRAQLSGVYRHIGAGGTVMRPTKEGPAMIFNNVKGHPGARVAIGMLASRTRVGHLLDCDPRRLGFLLNDAVKNPIPVQNVGADEAVCQEVVYKADDPDFDIRKLIPAPTNTEEDAGPYITMGMCYASDPETGESDVTIHRLCLQSKDEISMYFVPGARHLTVFREKAEKAGKPLPISISIGVDPAIEIAACFEPPTTPLGFNELTIAGAIRGEGVKMADCLTIDQKCIANAEYVIEGYLSATEMVNEDTAGYGFAMPEFPGYTGGAKVCPVINVAAVTTRKNPIMESCIGPSHEHVSMAGIPTEASIFNMVNKAMPGRLLNVHAAPCGGGKFCAILQFKKSAASDEGRQRNAAMLAFSAFGELKECILVDEDVDIFDMSDVMWAMTTRFQADTDIITIPGCHCHVLDPSNDNAVSGSIREHGIACKVIYDATVPFALKDRFVRSQFMEIDKEKWAAELEA